MMGQSLSNVLIHNVYSTKHRQQFLSNENLRQEMHAYLGGVCNNSGCYVLTVGGVADHVHILCSLSRTMAIADFLRELKSSSSKWVKTKGEIFKKFSWQSGYGVFSVGQTEIERVSEYIHNQEDHHRKITFQDEYRALMRQYNMEYDERYIWD
jgi:REP element-mobilizing transposase RayT